MGSDYITNPLNFIISVIFDLYIIAVMLRLLLQWVRADFYNPIGQLLLKVTSPTLIPLRRVIPSWKRLDLAALLLALLLTATKLLLIQLISGSAPNIGHLFIYAIAELVNLTLNIYLFSIFIIIILSWVAPQQHNPAINLLHKIVAPILQPARRLLPPISGFDFSAMFVLILIQLSKMLVIPPILALTRLI